MRLGDVQQADTDDTPVLPAAVHTGIPAMELTPGITLQVGLYEAWKANIIARRLQVKTDATELRSIHLHQAWASCYDRPAR